MGFACRRDFADHKATGRPHVSVVVFHVREEPTERYACGCELWTPQPRRVAHTIGNGGLQRQQNEGICSVHHTTVLVKRQIQFIVAPQAVDKALDRYNATAARCIDMINNSLVLCSEASAQSNQSQIGNELVPCEHHC